MNNSEFLNNYFNILYRDGIISSVCGFQRYLDYLFKNVVFENKSMLDIGGGSGLFSFYAACRGARKVVCLEPEGEGAHRGVTEIFKKIQASIKSGDRVKLDTATFQDFNYDGGFDIILLHNSVNHLDEEACSKLLNDRKATQDYRLLFQKINSLANAQAKLIITDCSRHNFFALCKIKNPFAPSIDWHKHQSPKFWIKLLNGAEFQNPKIRWASARLFGKGYFLTKTLLNNSFALYFLDSRFNLVMEKQ